MISTANPVLRHRALLLGTSAALALVLVKPAAAQCVVEPDNIITCSGDNDDQQTLNNGGSLTVTTEPGFSIDSPDNGLVLSGTGSLIYNDSNASTIIGRGYDGIAVGNGGGGVADRNPDRWRRYRRGPRRDHHQQSGNRRGAR